MTEWPRISLVTPSLNQGRFIGDTIRSVLAQDYPNLQYAIVDGGSTDETLAVIRRYSDRLDWWTSEPDAGQSDAIVKGFARADGVLMNWLNADDLLRPGALHAVARAYLETGAQLIAGGDRQFTVDVESPVSHFTPSGYGFPQCLRFWTGEFRYHQPCTFFTRAAYDGAGGLDTRLHYAMDYDLYCRMLRADDAHVAIVAEELSAFRLHPDAKTSSAKAGFVAEMRAVAGRLWPGDWSPQDRSAMDAYSAECSVMQAAEAWRQRAWRKSARALQLAYAYDAGHATRVIVGRALARRRHAGA